MYDYLLKGCPSPAISVHSPKPSSPDFTWIAWEQLSSSDTTSSSSPGTSDDDRYDRISDDDKIVLPAFDTTLSARKEKTSLERLDGPFGIATDRPGCKNQIPATDDASVEDEPSRHVDYFSHEWKEEDIWMSWRYISARRDGYNNGARLENASWRAWAKHRLVLHTVPPQALNWSVPHCILATNAELTVCRQKDCDVTWLYGPLKTCYTQDETLTVLNTSTPPSQLHSPSAYPHKKPILKKKTVSEAILQRSLLQRTLLQQAGAILRAQDADNCHCRSAFSGVSSLRIIKAQAVTSLGHTPTYTSSGVSSSNKGRHIHFNEEVSQCIAVEPKRNNQWPTSFEDGRISPWSSNNNKTIAPLPSATLQSPADTPSPPAASIIDGWSHNYSTDDPNYLWP